MTFFTFKNDFPTDDLRKIISHSKLDRRLVNFFKVRAFKMHCSDKNLSTRWRFLLGYVYMQT